MVKRIQNGIIAALLGVGFSLSVLYLLNHVPVPTVQAQGFAPFELTFQLPASLSAQYIPSCTISSKNCIPDYKQVAHTIFEIPTAGAAACNSLIDGSNDGTNYLTFGATSQSSGTPTQFSTTVNGYFPYTRIKVLPCTVAQTITYIGYSSPQPLLFSSNLAVATSISSATSIQTFYTPFVITGFQCSYPETTGFAFLELYFATPFNFELPIPAGQIFNYSGPPLSGIAMGASVGTNVLHAKAVTAQGGATPVTTPVECDFEFNSSGPFNPFFPVSP
jgi:hypothetical protein